MNDAEHDRIAKAITERVKERIAHEKAARAATAEIAALCVEGRTADITMSRLAELVQVYDPKKDEVRSVTRQAVDQLVAAHEGRERAPRKRGKKNQASPAPKASKIKLGAFE